ncbi:MAG: HNH endonuclease [Acidimicrobiia bacterium]
MSDLARRLNTADETRSIDQLRADVLLDLLEGNGHQAGPGRGMVDIHVDLDTLAGLSQAPGELAGFGPVIADIARQVADQQHHTQWRWTATDPDTGLPVHHGTTRRRPTPGQRRQVETGNPTCVFPGCRIPATQCDLDHRIPWSQGGPTSNDNLTPLCRHDHRIRHQTGWTHQPLPGGDHQWTSPLGHTYTTSGQPP